MNRLLLILATVALAAAGCGSKSSTAPPPPTLPECHLNVSSLAFDSVAVGTSADRQFTLANVGGGTLTGAISDTSSSFSIVGAADYQLAGGQQKTFTVRFSPQRVGPAQVGLVFSSGGCGSLSCTGTGRSRGPVCEIVGSSLDFGAHGIGSPSSWGFTVRNTGDQAFWAVVRGDRGDFLVDSTQAYYVLDPGMSAQVTVTYTPSFVGTSRCTLTVGENAGCDPVVLVGQGYLETHGFCSVAPTTPDTVDFGTVAVGGSALRTWSITNGSGSYWASGVIFNYSRSFAFVSDPFFNLSPGAQQSGQLRFSPSYPGVHYAAMPISCGLTGSGLTPGVQKYLMCKGVGVGGAPGSEALRGVAAPTLPASVGRLLRGQPTRARLR